MSAQIDIEDLKCPVTLDLLEEPVGLPCCGKSISREPLMSYYKSGKTNCPNCAVAFCDSKIHSIGDIEYLPVQKNVSYLVEQARATMSDSDSDSDDDIESDWSCKIDLLETNASSDRTTLGKMSLVCKKKTEFKTLLIPVIDISGSMGGSPLQQCKWAVEHMIDLAYRNDHLLMEVVTYQSTAYEYPIIKTKPKKETIDHILQEMNRSGGTVFASAFDSIVNVIKKYKDSPMVSRIEIVFLTDGQDYGAQGSLLVFKTKMDTLTKPFTIHSVGFGYSHSFELLDKLRKIGTKEGAYRFADPADDGDTLLNKISSVINVVTEKPLIPLDVVSFGEFKVLSKDDNIFWVDLTQLNLVKKHYVEVKVGSEDPQEIKVSFNEDQNDSKVWGEWYSIVIDRMIRQVTELSEKPNTLDNMFHCELIEQKRRVLVNKVNVTDADIERLNQLSDIIKAIKKGQSTDKLRLSDMQFEGKYTTQKSQQNRGVSRQQVNQLRSVVQQNYGYGNFNPTKKVGYWTEYTFNRGRRLYARESDPEFSRILGSKPWTGVNRYVDENLSDLVQFVDYNKNNIVGMAAMTGRYKPLFHMLSKPELSTLAMLNNQNSDGYNSIDLSILYGYWRAVEPLLDAGAKPTLDMDRALRTLLFTQHKNNAYINISNSYTNTASILIKRKLTTVDDEMIENAPTSAIVVWLNKYVGGDLPLEIAINKGVVERVEELIDTFDNIKWEPIKNILIDPNEDKLKIIKLLLEKKKIDPFETSRHMNDHEMDDLWPLFLACEKGNKELFELFLPYTTSDTIDKTSEKGATCLWMASCNGSIDFVGKLLGKGADPNVCRKKGDNPIPVACLNGHEMVVKMLLYAGAKLDMYNKERDNPVLCCCRKGHDVILKLILEHMDQDQCTKVLGEYNKIDGFVPLLACVELDKHECVRVCHEMKCDMDIFTEDDNQILPGANAMHLGCFYGKLRSVKVLHELGMKFDTKTHNTGSTPLHLAIKHGHMEVVRYILSTEEGRDTLEIPDNEGRTPKYYAKSTGNENILEEFFSNGLADIYMKVLTSGEEMEKKCAQVLTTYANSPGVYKYSDAVEVDVHDGMDLFVLSLLNGNKHLSQKLLENGVNVTKIDNQGVTGLFWLNYLGGKNKDNLITDSATRKMIDNVDKTININFENKMLLTLKGGDNVMIDDPLSNNSLAKMNVGFNDNVTDESVTELVKSSSMSHSILEFMEKLKRKKLLSHSRNMDYVLFDTRVNVIKRMAMGEVVLTPVQVMTIYLYTCNFEVFKGVNESLSDLSVKSPWYSYTNNLYSSVYALPSFEGELYRAVDVQFDMEKHKIGNELTWNSFTMCSYEWKNVSDMLNKKSGIIFIIKSKTGKKIDKYSKFPMDCESLLLPGSKFKITNHYRPGLICLGQANIRHISYYIREKDYVNALAGKDCIIIELEEIDLIKEVN